MTRLQVCTLMVGATLLAGGSLVRGDAPPSVHDRQGAASRQAPPSDPSLTSAVVNAVQEVLKRRPLTFSSEPGTPDRFELMLTVVVPLKGGNSTVTNYVIARDKGEVAVLVLSSTGAPYAYGTNGLLVGFDPTERGRLVVYDRGVPAVTVGMSPASGNFGVDVSFRGVTGTAALRIELEPVLRAALSHLELATFDPGRRVVKLETRNTTLGLFMPQPGASGGPAEAEAPLRGLVIRAKGGLAVALSNFRTAHRSAILGRARADFEKLGLPTRAANAGSPKLPLFVPAAFGKDERERGAVERLRSVFPDLRFEPAVTPSSPMGSDVPTRV